MTAPRTRPSRWRMVNANPLRGSQTYRQHRLEEYAAIKAMQQLVTAFVTGGGHDRLNKTNGPYHTACTLGALSWSSHHA